MISREGDRLVITPLRKRGLAALLDSWEPMDESLPELDDPPPEPEDVF
jgi:antitoxin VapB